MTFEDVVREQLAHFDGDKAEVKRTIMKWVFDPDEKAIDRVLEKF